MSYQLLSQAGVAEAVSRRREMVDDLLERELVRSIRAAESEHRPSPIARLRSWMTRSVAQRPAERLEALRPRPDLR